MKLIWSAMAVSLTAWPCVQAWGGLGHITIAYIASNLISAPTTTYLQSLLHNDTADFLAGVATWADSYRYTREGRHTGPFHFIDAKDAPPTACSVDLARDCKPEGCVVSAIDKFTTQLLPQAQAHAALPAEERVKAAKFVIHLVGDVHQPLHLEDVEKGGNGIDVLFDGRRVNLHHVWDTSIVEKLIGGVRGAPYDEAHDWAAVLTHDIREGRYADKAKAWLDAMDLDDPTSTALAWAREGNAYICGLVFPDSPEAIAGQELGGEYFDKAAPIVELQVARAGYRLAAWLDLIVSRIEPPGVSRSAVVTDL